MNTVAAGATKAVGVGKHVAGKAIAAIAELGAAGLTVVTRCLKDGFDKFGKYSAEVAKAVGRSLSGGFKDSWDGAKDATGKLNPSNW